MSARMLEVARSLGVSRAAAYCAFRGEPETRAFLETAAASSIEVLVPVMRGIEIAWVRHDARTPLRAHPRLGVPEPVSATSSASTPGVDALETCDVVFVPAAAIDHDGYRLGWGLGTYDRALARRRRIQPVYAIVYDEELVDAVPREPHDVPVDAAITPSRIVGFEMGAPREDPRDD